MTRFESVAEAIGGTPLIRLTKTGLRPRIYVKPEWYNPGGSVKDRAALSMLRAAEASGALAPGGTVVETTSGNTGIGLALYAAHLGYRSVIFTSSSISKEKRDLLVAHGAELRLVDAFVPKTHPDSLKSVAERFVASTPGAWLANQYDNPANPAAHVATTGPEIWADSEGSVTHFVATVGTGGTISGTGRFLKEASAGAVRIIGADPATSSYSGGDGSQKFIEGAGHFVHPLADEDTWPESLDLTVIDAYSPVTDAEAIATIREVARTEGILAGGSSGVALAAGLRLAASLDESATVVILLPDSGRAYLSTYYNDDWLLANGFRTEAGDVVGAVAAPLRTIGRSRTGASAAAELVAAGAGEEPVAVLYERERTTADPHHADVAGWTTAARLAEAGTAADAALPTPVRLGAGESRGAAAGRAASVDPDWQVALVLDEGRVRGLVTRARLEQATDAPH
ncbi:cysteine synthase family protein [Gryllotalpicola koreensis]|uniref:Tryptophan synthase beta chain-like PALP domain-containing protein n=1 Tax=Gryllotalpicola koreensis TaxID=993086 RepID=A0ABP8A5Z2_9MICO